MNVFHDLISRLSTAEERISELEDNQQKLLKNRKRKKNGEETPQNRTEHARAQGQYHMVQHLNLPDTWNPRRKRQRMGRRNIRRHTVECFPKIMKWRTLNHGSKKLKESQVG